MAVKHDVSAEEQQRLKRFLSNSVLLEESNSHLNKSGPEDHVQERKAKNCIDSNDIQRIIDLGLGRGVDTTDPTPWQNKTSFQVRPVTFGNIIGTEEGGLVQSYERDVSSVSELRGNASASVTNPKSAVTVGVEGEYSQSSTSRRKVVGTKVSNRTISFKDHCDDNDIEVPSGEVTFQSWLCKWILEKRVAELSIVIRDEKIQRGNSLAKGDSKIQPMPQSSPEAAVKLDRQHTLLNSVLSSLSLGDGTKKSPKAAKLESDSGATNETTMLQVLTKHIGKDIVGYCRKFISQFHVTHYVSSIQLGASGYEVVSESAVAKKLGVGGRVGVEKIATGSAGASYGKYHSKRSRDLHRIGVIELKGGIAVVERGTHDEAVIGIQIKPVSDLVKIPELRKPLQEALVQYITNEADISSGPFKILCSPAPNLYLKAVTDTSTDNLELCLSAVVDSGNTLANGEICSYFYLKPCNNSEKHPDEFYICYYDTPDEIKTVSLEVRQAASDSDDEFYEPVPFYLQAPVNTFGTNEGPLHLQVYSKERDCRFVLESSIVKQHQRPVSLSAWMSGKEMCFIKCARRRSIKSAYLAVQHTQSFPPSVRFPELKDVDLVYCVNSRDNATLFQIVHTDVTWEKNHKRKTADYSGYYSKRVLASPIQ